MQTECAAEADVIKNLMPNQSHPKTQTLFFPNIISFSKLFAANHHKFSFFECKDSFFLAIQEKIKPFKILCNIWVKSDKYVEFFSNGFQLERKIFESFFSRKYFITSLDKFRNLLEFISLNHLNFVPSSQNPIEAIRKSHSCNDLIDFFEEQLNLSKMPSNKRRYSPGLTIFCFIILSRSRSAFLQMSEYFFIPCERTLRRYSSSIGTSLKSDDQNFMYFKKQCEALLPHERDISLKHDEIQIKSKAEFRAGELYSYSKNNKGQSASNLQCFMIRSMKSKYQEMVKLTPVFKQNASFLKDLLLDTIDFLENVGFRVFVVTSDNAPINSNVAKILTNSFSRY